MSPDRKAMLVWGGLLRACRRDEMAANCMAKWFVAGDEEVTQVIKLIEEEVGVTRKHANALPPSDA